MSQRAISFDRCPMASLVEARRDGRLGEREAASLVRHLGTCSACVELERDLDEVRDLLRRAPGPSLTALEHQRNRLALLRAAAAPPASRDRPSRWGVLFSRPAAAIAITAMTAAAALGLALPRTLTGGREAAPMIAQHLPVIVLRGVDPGRSDVDPLRVYPAETTLRGSADARFEQRVGPDGVERVSLSEGTLDLAVRKLSSGERFMVVTDDAEVEVRGTVFEVEAHAGRIAGVSVSEGKVEVRHRGALSVVAAGGAWRPPVEMGAVAMGAPPPNPRERVLAMGAASSSPRGKVFFTGVRGTTGASVGEVPEDSEASTAFGAAVDMLGRGDYAAARVRLDAFRAAHPADGRADLAAFLVIVSLQHAGRRAEAQEAARRYLELYPEGDRRAEAVRVAAGR